MTGRDPFAKYRDRLSAMGFQPSRRWGQNFLLDPTLHAYIADQGALEEGDLAVEVGVGLGFLTRELAQRAGAVLGVEVDSRLAHIAREELAPWPHVQLVVGDVMAGPDGLLPEFLSALDAALRRHPQWRLVANLPYAVAGPFLAEVLALPQLPVRVVCLVQEEFAERLAAAAATRTFGSLTAVIQGAYRARVARKVGPQVFRPRPRVGSAILVLERRDQNPGREDLGITEWPAAQRKAYGIFVRALFQQRRKRLSGQWPRALRAANLDGLCPAELADARPEMVAPLALAAFFEAQVGAHFRPPG